VSAASRNPRRGAPVGAMTPATATARAAGREAETWQRRVGRGGGAPVGQTG